MGEVRENGGKPYEAPALRIVGSVHALTLQDKTYGPTDGFTLMGVAITNSSP
jgi:hypothetical protein